MATNNTSTSILSLTTDYQSFTEDLVKEMSETRKAMAYFLGKLNIVELKLDKILKESNNPEPCIERGYRT